LVRH
jgi:transposase